MSHRRNTAEERAWLKEFEDFYQPFLAHSRVDFFNRLRAEVNNEMVLRIEDGLDTHLTSIILGAVTTLLHEDHPSGVFREICCLTGHKIDMVTHHNLWLACRTWAKRYGADWYRSEQQSPTVSDVLSEIAEATWNPDLVEEHGDRPLHYQASTENRGALSVARFESDLIGALATHLRHSHDRLALERRLMDSGYTFERAQEILTRAEALNKRVSRNGASASIANLVPEV